ncbi:hypothetical protein OSU_2136 [Vibrio cholerae PS15]|nr:hypothetical protein OSU_2136 [Vibrio cholerae PS15]
MTLSIAFIYPHSDELTCCLSATPSGLGYPISAYPSGWLLFLCGAIVKL